MEKHRFYTGLKGKPANHIQDFNTVMPDWSHERKAAEVEFYIAKKIGEDLVATYPGRQWQVNVDTRNNMVIISMPALSKREGYHLHMRRDTIASLLPRCRKAAGEILERFNQSRTNRIVTPDKFDELPRDVQDNVIAPDRHREMTMKWNNRGGR